MSPRRARPRPPGPMRRAASATPRPARPLPRLRRAIRRAARPRRPCSGPSPPGRRRAARRPRRSGRRGRRGSWSSGPAPTTAPRSPGWRPGSASATSSTFAPQPSARRRGRSRRPLPGRSSCRSSPTRPAWAPSMPSRSGRRSWRRRSGRSPTSSARPASSSSRATSTGSPSRSARSGPRTASTTGSRPVPASAPRPTAGPGRTWPAETRAVYAAAGIRDRLTRVPTRQVAGVGARRRRIRRRAGRCRARHRALLERDRRAVRHDLDERLADRQRDLVALRVVEAGRLGHARLLPRALDGLAVGADPGLAAADDRGLEPVLVRAVVERAEAHHHHDHVLGRDASAVGLVLLLLLPGHRARDRCWSCGRTCR